METTNATLTDQEALYDQMLTSIETQATGSFGTYNPVAKVTCPHCGATMQALDAKVHVARAIPLD